MKYAGLLRAAQYYDSLVFNINILPRLFRLKRKALNPCRYFISKPTAENKIYHNTRFTLGETGASCW